MTFNWFDVALIWVLATVVYYYGTESVYAKLLMAFAVAYGFSCVLGNALCRKKLKGSNDDDLK